MFEAIGNEYLVPFDGAFSVGEAATKPPDDAPGKKENKVQLEDLIDEMRDLQRMLYAQDKFALLLVFQAMDAAGKDGTIRGAVMSGVNPAGVQVFSFKAPTPEELDHDFLWRTTVRLPERGRIGIFNRSYYEEVLVVRVQVADIIVKTMRSLELAYPTVDENARAELLEMKEVLEGEG